MKEKIKKMKTLIIKGIFILFTIVLHTELYAYKVLKRSETGCSSSGCNSTSKQLCDVGGTTGWCIDCSGSGSSKCPTYLVPPNSGDPVDEIDVVQGNIGLSYALEQIEAGVNNGSYTYNFTENNGIVRIYIVNWNYSKIGDDVNSIINVDRE